MKKKYLMTPGPTPVAETTQAAMSRPIIHHRHPEFRAIFGEVREGLKMLFQTKQEVLLLAGSGTAAMEAAVVNTFSRGDKALVVQAGKFGERWGEICRAYGIETETIDVPWGQAVSVSEVDKRLAKGGFKGLLVQATETSTGVVHPLRELGALTRNSPTLLIVDGITGVGVFNIPFDEWGLDVLLTGSQKALMLPPGLAMICFSDKAWRAVENGNLPRYYLDLKRERKKQQDNQTAFTPAISLILGLHEVLERMKKLGLANIFAENARLARALREAVLAMGLALYAPDSPSDAVTAVKTPQGIDGQEVVRLMRDKYGIAIAGGQDQAKGKIIRIATMGYISELELIGTIAALERTLLDLGARLEPGRGVARAAQILLG